jgi:hypothetical protein
VPLLCPLLNHFIQQLQGSRARGVVVQEGSGEAWYP